MYKLFLIVVLLLFASLTGMPVKASQPPITSALILPTKNPFKKDSSKIEIRKFDQQKIKTYRSNPDFIYENIPVDQNLWGRFWSWFWGLIESAFKNPYSGKFLKYLVILAVVALVVFIVIKLIGLDIKIFSGKSKAVNVPYTESLDNIHEINFNNEIEKAMSTGNYRLAVRLLYLHVLKKLSDKNLIDWQPEKTNQTYVREITDPGTRKQFGLLTRQFEYIWYGEFYIDKENFNQVKDTYDTFSKETL